ncbi:hypothetical protein Pint_12619 [Pistacia integerrima]|uniref:Uncharacterized protein n=1 Tax=Pistacia integerrima TaxID=434235 RepID=A0ACC0Y3M6_9ROSI|nr:hypothetical protein Pint_12619 [Pistacia integerrima]
MCFMVQLSLHLAEQVLVKQTIFHVLIDKRPHELVVAKTIKSDQI